VTALLEIRNLRVVYRGAEAAPAVAGVDLDLAAGGTLGLVGETGCGKSTVAHAVIDLLGPAAEVSGSIRLDGLELVGTDAVTKRGLRGSSIALVPQAAINGLNPVVRVGDQVAETLRLHGVRDRVEVRRRVLETFDLVELPRDRISAFPHELSGGMRQRVAIAMALVGRPRLVIADEPTTALDVVVQGQILDTIARLRAELGFALLLISHDLGVIAEACDRVAVMNAGRVIEEGPTQEVFGEPRHEYTRELKRAADGTRPERTTVVPPGEPFLRFEGVTKEFALHRSAFSRLASSRSATIRAADDVSLEIRRGEVLAVVGQSGSGKSTIANLALGLEKPTSGSITLDGRPLAELSRLERTSRIQMVFQDPFRSLDPRRRAFEAVAEPLRAHGITDRDEVTARVRRALEAAQLSPAARFEDRFPHELSGGQRQRLVIARALALEPALIVADEPVSMLDVSVQSGVLDVLLRMRDELEIGYLFITHDLRVAEHVSDRIAVIYHGRIVETGPTEQLLAAPSHDYTRLLLDSVPGRKRR
jgi:peptide/nickel transport system ATP-binding protein